MSLTGVWTEPFTLALLSLIGSLGDIALGCPIIHRRLVICGCLVGATIGYESPSIDNIAAGVREPTRTRFVKDFVSIFSLEEAVIYDEPFGFRERLS